MSERLIHCHNVGKKYCRSLAKGLWYGLCDIADEFLLRKAQHPMEPALRNDEFWANSHITFEVRRGECLGLIGRNGAGKTTLLKMINGLIKPDTGEIQLRGTIGALIALGAGFNPILTARENIYVNAAVLGLSARQIAASFDEIVDFSGLREFLDMPLQSFSSGMKVRLGFAIASTIRPDVLIIDEVLAVGDADFRIKSGKRITELLCSGCAVILVSHDLSQIANLSTQTVWLDGGQVKRLGKASEVIHEYLAGPSVERHATIWCSDETMNDASDVRITRIAVAPSGGLKVATISSGFSVQVAFDCRRGRLLLDFTLEVITADGVVVFHSGDVIREPNGSRIGEYQLEIAIPGYFLNSGEYLLSVIIGDSQSTILARIEQAVQFRIHHEPAGNNFSQLPGITAPRFDWNYSVVEPSAMKPKPQ